MVPDTPNSPDDPIDNAPDRGRMLPRNRGWLDTITSIPALIIGSVLMVLIAAGPMQHVDSLLARRWLYHIEPDLLWFAQNVLDRVAGQAVCLPILIVVAVVLARRRRSWRPIQVAVLAELAFLIGVGVLKLIFARPVTYSRDPSFFDGGFLDMGTKGISFPSGHASEAVLIYGTVVYLITHYSSASPRLLRLLRWGVVVISGNSVVVSFLLGWHWASDLLGGLMIGGLYLRIITQWDERLRARKGIEASRAG